MKSAPARTRKARKLKRWVVKAGSNMVCAGGPILLRAWMQQVAALRKDHGIEVIWVTSGAIASAVDRLGIEPRANLAEKQALSAIGQPLVMDLYLLALQASGLMGAQVLLTYDDLANSRRRNNFQATLEMLMKWGIVPVLNENDAVATEEIRFGDNDSLSAKVAAVSGAERLVILTDVAGVYDRDPRKHRGAILIDQLEKVTPTLIREIAGGAGSSRGTGGMFSKLTAAREASRQGVATSLVQGDLAGVLTDLAAGKSRGTFIPGKSSP